MAEAKQTEAKPEKKGLPLLEDLANHLERASSNSDYTKIISILEILKESDLKINEHMMKKTNIGSIVKNLKKNHVLNKQIASLSDSIILKWKLNIYEKLPDLNKDKNEEKEQKRQVLTATKAALSNLTKVRVTDKYVLFYQGCFSQFYKANIIIDGKQYFCCEQYMMAEKAKLFKDHKILQQIMNEKNQPMKCKKLGRKVSNFQAKLWDKNKEIIVYKGNYAKYTQNEDLADELLKYENRTFVEASAKDRIWGIGLSVHDKKCNDKKTWNGQNLLGIAITKVRNQILDENKKGNANDTKNDII